MSINKLISIKNPIVNALDMAALDHNKHLPLFMTWAYEAEEEIGSHYQFERQHAVLDICGCAANLPDNCVKVESAIIGNHTENCGDFFNKIFSTTVSVNNSQNTFLIVDSFGLDECNYGYVPYEFQNNKLIFTSNVNAEHITIQYLGYKVDCDGFMEIGQNHVQAITNYILYKWKLRKQGKTGADMQEMQWYYKEWDRLCAHSRALDAKLSETDREEIAQMYHNPYSGRGLYVGMNKNSGNGGFYY